MYMYRRDLPSRLYVSVSYTCKGGVDFDRLYSGGTSTCIGGVYYGCTRGVCV